ncbi:MAG: hypothetical protein K8F59_05825 [Rhodobacteraceae bacterium]|nr:hypothetical protein [Paracoccaceae bacterium]MCB1368443.1 hypothetical protein [Paracoccaceae bacterium]
MRKQILSTVLAVSLSAASTASVSAEPQNLPPQITSQHWEQLTPEQQQHITKSSSYVSPFMLLIMVLAFIGMVWLPPDSLRSSPVSWL